MAEECGERRVQDRRAANGRRWLEWEAGEAARRVLQLVVSLGTVAPRPPALDRSGPPDGLRSLLSGRPVFPKQKTKACTDHKAQE